MKIKTTAKKLLEFKKKYNLKQTTLATMMSINKYTLNRWLTGKRTPSIIYDKLINKFLSKNNY